MIMTFNLTPTCFDFYAGEYPIRWEQVTAKPELVIFKASENKFRDSRVVEYVTQAKERGIRYGLYHFLRENDIMSQAQTFITAINLCGGIGNIAPIVDVEIYPVARGRAWANQVKTFLDLIEQAFGKKPIIYTSPNFWKEVCSRNTLYQLVPPSWTSEYGLWAAGYPYPEYLTPGMVMPKSYLPLGWTKYAIWQYNDDGRGNGYFANDLNVLSDWFMEELKDISVEPIPSKVTYSVTASVLNVRPEPNTNKQAVGQVSKGEVLEGLGLNSDKTWANIRHGNLTGWCSKAYLQLLTGSEDIIPPDPIPPVGDDTLVKEYKLFHDKAQYKQYVSHTSRGDITYHVMKVPHKYAEIFITPSPRNVQAVAGFLKSNHVQIAINGDGWVSKKVSNVWKIIMSGFNASRGVAYGTPNTEQTFFISENGVVTLRKNSGLWNAISFPNILVEDGKVSDKIKRKDVDPRTALGFSFEHDVIMVCVDGKETYNTNRTGMTFTEVASILVREGAWVGANLDGGGSTTMVIEGDDLQPSILNTPCGENPYTDSHGVVHRVRSVANHFGIYIR
jgi:lysozyme